MEQFENIVTIEDVEDVEDAEIQGAEGAQAVQGTESATSAESTDSDDDVEDVERAETPLLEVKRWTVEEELSIIQALLEGREVPKPKAKTYYRRFVPDRNYQGPSFLEIREKLRKEKESQPPPTSETPDEANEPPRGTLLQMSRFFYEFERKYGFRRADYAAIDDRQARQARQAECCCYQCGRNW